jgi:hypothetical protein
MTEGPLNGGDTESAEPSVATGLGRGTIEPVQPAAGDDFLAPQDDGESMAE